MLQGRVAGHDPKFNLTRIELVAAGEVTGELWVRQHTLPIGAQVRVHLHANDVSLSLHEPKDTSIQNRLSGVVQSIDPDVHAANRMVAIDCQGQQVLARVTARAIAELQINPGTAVWCQIKSVALAGH